MEENINKINKLSNKINNINIIAQNNIYFSEGFKKYSSELTTLQKRLIFFAISKLKTNDRFLSAFEFSKKGVLVELDEFISLFKLNSGGGKIYKEIEREVLNLQKKPVSYIDNLGIIHNISWFSSTHFYNKNAIKEKNRINNLNIKVRDYIVLYFTEEISHFLVDLTNYVKYNFFISHSLKSVHAIRIYELLQTRKDTNFYFCPIEEFCDLLSLSDTYRKSNSQLKKYVLEKASHELNTKLDLGFSYKIEDNTVYLKSLKNDNDLFVEHFSENEELLN